MNQVCEKHQESAGPETFYNPQLVKGTVASMPDDLFVPDKPYVPFRTGHYYNLHMGGKLWYRALIIEVDGAPGKLTGRRPSKLIYKKSMKDDKGHWKMHEFTEQCLGDVHSAIEVI